MRLVPLLLALSVPAVAGEWSECGAGQKDVRSIALDGAGRIFVAADWMGGGDALVSTDRCTSFTPLGLKTESVWSVDWLPHAKLLCAGTRDGLFCSGGGPMRGPLSIASTEIYFAREFGGGVIAGGYPALYVGTPDARSFALAGRWTHVTSDAAIVGRSLFVAGPGVLVSDDGGRSFRAIAGAPSPSRVLAARGKSLYVAGGTFGGYLKRSDDGGRTWKTLVMPGSQPEIILAPPDRPGVLLLGTHGDVTRGDAFLSLDDGQTWRMLHCPGAEIHALALDDKFLYCGATSLAGPKGMWRLPLAALGWDKR